MISLLIRNNTEVTHFIVYMHVTCGSVVLLGCYGDVLRVKILYNKKDSALIQFAESFQAQTGLYIVVIYCVCTYMY